MADATGADKDLCQFCLDAKFRYTCPKCNACYCSVACYKSPKHLKCSEEFYKNCIQDELSAAEPNSGDEMRKIYDILKRIRESDVGFNPEDFDADGLNDLLDSDDEVPAEADNCEQDNFANDNDDDDGEADIATRMQGIDINNADDVWTRLTPGEQEEFKQLIENGDIMKLLPDYKPWWHKRQNSKIVVLPAKGDNLDTDIPAICQNIKKFADICKRTPSSCLHYNLWNILAAYSCVVRFFAGEHQTNPCEAVSHLVNLSATLKYGTNFEDVEDAIISVEMEAITTGNGPAGAPATSGSSSLFVESREQLQRDVRQLMSLHEYKLAALSDVLQLFMRAKQLHKRQNSEQADFQKLFALCTGSVELNRNKLQQFVMKFEFMLSYVNRDNSND